MKKGNIITSTICMIVSIIVLVVAAGYPRAEAYGTGVPGPGMWPICIAACMLVTSIALLISALRTKKEDDTELGMWNDGTKRVYISMIGLVVYVVALNILGFIIATILMLFGFIQWFSKAKPVKSIIISVLVTLLIYCIFKFLLNVPVDFGLFYF